MAREGLMDDCGYNFDVDEDSYNSGFKEGFLKAVDEFSEKLGILCENSAMALDRYNGRPLYNKDGKWHDLINDVAEQLKEE